MNISIKKILKDQIANNNFNEVIDTLLSASTDHEELYNEVILIKAQYINLEKLIRLSVVSVNEQRIEFSKFTYALLQLLDRIDDDQLINSDDTTNEGNKLWDNLPTELTNIHDLLKFRTRITKKYYGRENDMQDVLNWILLPINIERKIGILWGVGGVGKSRFSNELIQKIIEIGWHGAFIESENDIKFSKLKKGFLFILDYPEERQDEVTQIISKIRSVTISKPIKLLLVSRNGIDWWKKSDLPILRNNYLFSDIFEKKLEKLNINSTIELFRETLNVVSQKYNYPEVVFSNEEIEFWILKNNEVTLPLYTITSAIYIIINQKNTLDIGEKEIFQDISQRERQRINRVEAKIGFKKDSLVSLSVIASICGEIDSDLILKLSDKSIGLNLPNEKKILVKIKNYYLWDKRKGVLNSVKPDILASTILSEELMCTGSSLLKPLSVFIELLVSENSEGLIDKISRVVFDSGKIYSQNNPVLTSLIKIVEKDYINFQILKYFTQEFRPSYVLLPFVIKIDEKLVQVETNLLDKFKHLVYYSAHLIWAEDYKKAINPFKEAESIAKDLEISKSLKLVELYSEFLHIASMLYNHLGQNQTALINAKESVDVLKKNYTYMPIEVKYKLSQSLKELSNAFKDNRQYKEAIETSDEAIEICAELNHETKGIYENELARLYHNRALVFLALNDNINAHLNIDKATNIRKKLVVSKPDRYEKYLAFSMDQNVEILCLLEKWDEALSLVDEVIKIRYELAKINPIQFGILHINALQLKARILDSLKLNKEKEDVELERSEVILRYDESGIQLNYQFGFQNQSISDLAIDFLKLGEKFYIAKDYSKSKRLLYKGIKYAKISCENGINNLRDYTKAVLLNNYAYGVILLIELEVDLKDELESAENNLMVALSYLKDKKDTIFIDDTFGTLLFIKGKIENSNETVQRAIALMSNALNGFKKIDRTELATLTQDRIIEAENWIKEHSSKF